VTNETNCPLREGATSFYEGCLVYVEDPDRGADEDGYNVDKVKPSRGGIRARAFANVLDFEARSGDL
jgi:hypothetical protein